MKTMLLILLVFLARTIFPSGTESNASPNKSIEIVIPAKGSSISCSKTKSGKRLHFTAKGNSINLNEGEFITLFLRPTNENEWVRISDPMKIEQNNSNLWAFNIDTVIGKRYKLVELSAVVSSSVIKATKLDYEAFELLPSIISRSQNDFTVIFQ